MTRLNFIKYLPFFIVFTRDRHQCLLARIKFSFATIHNHYFLFYLFYFSLKKNYSPTDIIITVGLLWQTCLILVLNLFWKMKIIYNNEEFFFKTKTIVTTFYFCVQQNHSRYKFWNKFWFKNVKFLILKQKFCCFKRFDLGINFIKIYFCYSCHVSGIYMFICSMSNKRQK